MSGKRKESERDIRGAPDIAHPDSDEKWELQTAFFTAFLFEMWDRAEARDKKAAREARAELQTFFLNSIDQSLHGNEKVIAVIRVYDAAGNVIGTHKHEGDFNTERINAWTVKVSYEADCRTCHRFGARHKLDTIQFIGAAK